MIFPNMNRTLHINRILSFFHILQLDVFGGNSLVCCVRGRSLSPVCIAAETGNACIVVVICAGDCLKVASLALLFLTPGSGSLCIASRLRSRLAHIRRGLKVKYQRN